MQLSLQPVFQHKLSFADYEVKSFDFSERALTQSEISSYNDAKITNNYDIYFRKQEQNSKQKNSLLLSGLNAGFPIEKFSKSTIIEINHYKDVFNRPNQDFQIQKSSMKLILAKKTAPFLYPASEMVQEFGSPNVFYNTPILNCLYNCDYFKLIFDS